MILITGVTLEDVSVRNRLGAEFSLAQVGSTFIDVDLREVEALVVIDSDAKFKCEEFRTRNPHISMLHLVSNIRDTGESIQGYKRVSVRDMRNHQPVIEIQQFFKSNNLN